MKTQKEIVEFYHAAAGWPSSSGIKVIVADGDTTNQIAEGKAPFNRIPTTAAAVQIFPNMPNALISGGN